jgi:zinc transporter ZupT
LASGLACVVTTLGIVAIGKYEAWAQRNTVYFMSFVVGVLISVSFIHLIPESFQMSTQAPIFLLGGFLALYLLNRFLKLYVCHEYGREAYTISLISMVGIGFHSFLDGIIYAVTFNVSIFTGALSAIGMVLHEFPEGIVTFSLLQRGQFSKKKSIWYAFLAAAVTTPLGAVVSYPFINNISLTMLGSLLAISAGALTYVAAVHLLPEVEKENRRYSIISLSVGILVAVFIVMIKGQA